MHITATFIALFICFSTWMNEKDNKIRYFILKHSMKSHGSKTEKSSKQKHLKSGFFHSQRGLHKNLFGLIYMVGMGKIEFWS